MKDKKQKKLNGILLSLLIELIDKNFQYDAQIKELKDEIDKLTVRIIELENRPIPIPSTILYRIEK